MLRLLLKSCFCKKNHLIEKWSSTLTNKSLQSNVFSTVPLRYSQATSNFATYNPGVKNEPYQRHKLLKKSINRPDFFRILSSSFHLSSQKFQEGGSGSGSHSSSSGNNQDDEDKKRKDLLKKQITNALLLTLTIYFFTTVFSFFPASQNDKKQTSKWITWNEFVYNFLASGEVEEVIVHPYLNIVSIVLFNDAVINGKKVSDRHFHMNIDDLEQFENRLRETEDLLGIRPDQRVPIVYNRNSDDKTRLVFSVVMAALVLAFLIKKSGAKMPMDIGAGFSNPLTRAKFTAIDPLIPGSGKGVKFSDVAGSEQAKQEVMEFVEFLKNPARYQKLGARVPKGALLLGPPGCGKTLLAKAVATEGKVPFLAMNGSEFIEMIGGVGAARVRDLFKEAKERAPCIIYIDEIDAIGRQRSSQGSLREGDQESEQTLNQLLVEMDGIMSKEGVVLLASTNRFDILDKAILRPGRFDRHIMMELPTLDERKLIFDHHLKSIILEKPIAFYSKRMAYLTLGFSGADIANVTNEAALHAARNAQKVVKAVNLEYAVERMVGGTEKRTQVVSPEEKKVIAFHESGHALVGWLLEHTDALLKVTIVPRTSEALGFAQYTPKEKYLYDQRELLEKMCMALGGRVAESLVFNRITTGAKNDLEKVTKMAYSQVRLYGFSDKVGQVSYPEEDNEENEHKKKFYSKKMAATIDSEASKIIFEAYQLTEELLKKNMDQLKLLAESLLEKETLNYEDVEAILGPPPHGQKTMVEQVQFENELKTWDEKK